MIDRGDIRQAIDRCSNIWGFTAGRWLWSVRHKADSLIAKSERSGENGQEITRAESPRLSPLWLSAYRLPVMGC